MIPVLFLLACGNPCEESFSMSDELSAGQVAEAIEAYQLTTAADISCEQVCTVVYEDARGSSVRSVTSCDMGLDSELADASSDNADALVGNILCEGWALQPDC